MRKLLCAVAGLALAGGLAAAPASAATGYGPAGCGLGSIVFGNQPGFVQVFAATTNGTFASQTFGITFGTSNCGEAAANQIGTRVFIEANREALAKDIARGSGETISSLSSLAGCRDAALVGATLQQNFSTIFPSENVSTGAVQDSILNTLRGEALACTEVG